MMSGAMAVLYGSGKDRQKEDGRGGGQETKGKRGEEEGRETHRESEGLESPTKWHEMCSCKIQHHIQCTRQSC